MTIAKYLALAGFAVALPAAVLAQDGEVKFWLQAAPNNLQGCIAADPQFTREHTFTLKGGQAEVEPCQETSTSKLKLHPAEHLRR